jgi:hypothetical protein
MEMLLFMFYVKKEFIDYPGGFINAAFDRDHYLDI